MKSFPLQIVAACATSGFLVPRHVCMHDYFQGEKLELTPVGSGLGVDKIKKVNMMDAKIERISEIISFALHLMKNREVFSKTKLVKILYLLDVVKSRQGSPNFTGIEYKSYYYGPYSEEIEDSLSLLISLDHISINEGKSFNGNSYYHIKLNQMPDFGHLTDQEKKDIKTILSPLISRDLDDVLGITYNTKEYRETPFGEVISL